MLTYRLSGADASSFDIDSDGQITVGMGVTFNAAMKDEYAVTVTADDGEGETAMVEVTITVTAGPVLPPVIIITGGGGGGGGGGGPTPSEVDFEWTVTRDIEELDGGNDRATGVWSDGTTLWVADNADGAGDAVYAYDRASGERVERARVYARRDEPRTARLLVRPQCRLGLRQRPGTALRLRPRHGGAPGGARVRAGRATAMRAASGRTGRRCGCWTAAPTRSSPTASRAASCSPSTPSTTPTTTPTASGPTASPSGSPTTGRSGSSPTACPCCRRRADSGRRTRNRRDLERVRDEEFGKLSRASNNSPRGIWSDGDVMYVADASDGKVYSYNLPDAIDARLASLALSGIEFGEFDPGVPEYEGVPGDGVTETTVEAAAAQDGATVVIEPEDADGDDANGHQVALQDLGEITVTVTSQDGSRKKTYRVQFPETAWDPARDPWPHCLRGAVSVGFSLVVYEGGSVEELVSCAESRGIVAFYALHEGVYVSHILGAPDFVNAGFLELFPDGLPPITPLIVASNGPPSADPFGDLEDGGQQPWPECLRGAVAAGFSLVVYEGGSVDELEACARSADITALYALSEGEFVSYILGAPAFVTQPFRDLFAEGLPLMAPLVVKSEGLP